MNIQPWLFEKSAKTERTIVSCSAGSDTEDTASDLHSVFGNFINSTEVTINLFKLTPKDLLTSQEQKATDDQTFFRELSVLREKRATRIEQMSHHSEPPEQYVTFEQASIFLREQGAHRSDPGVLISKLEKLAPLLEARPTAEPESTFSDGRSVAFDFFP